MKVLLYWHDIYLPYSDYLIRGFASNPRIRELCIVGPDEYEADAIYSGSVTDQSFSEKVIFKKIKTYSFRKKWGPVAEFKKCIQEFRPDCIIVLDEAFSVNVLNAAIANYLAKNRATVLFYSFENIKQTPPFRYLAEHFSVKSIWVFIRKTIRYLLADALLQPIRSRLVHGGLACYSESVNVVHQFGWNPRVKIQWWGLDLKPFLQANEASFGKSYSSPKSQATIGYVGRFIKDKGVFDLVEAFAKLDNHYRLVMVGSGPEEVALKEMVRDLKLEGRVQFIPPRSRDELAKIYASFDLLVLPSRTDYFWKEQYGRVLVEAMACGTPVAGSQSGAIPIVIGDQTHCFAEGNATQLAEVIESTIVQYETGDIGEIRNALAQRAQLGNIDSFVDAFIDLHLELSNKSQ